MTWHRVDTKETHASQTLRSALWQRVIGGVVFGFLGGLGVLGCIKSFNANLFPFLADFRTPLSGLLSGLAMALFCLCCWLHNERYYLFADSEGMLQRTWLGTKKIRWSDVASYRREELRSAQGRQLEPVLYDAMGRVLLRPCAPLMVGTAQMDAERALFWQFVEEQLVGKRKGVL
jgi:hypothetical protein